MKEKVEKLLGLIGNEDLFKKLRDEYLKHLNEQIDDPEIFEEFMCLIINEFKYETFRDETSKNYMEIYTEEEMDYMLNYYSSDIGQSIIEKNTIMVTRSMTLSQKIVVNFF